MTEQTYLTTTNYSLIKCLILTLPHSSRSITGCSNPSSFPFLDFNYFSFVRVWCAFAKALSLFLQAWAASGLIFPTSPSSLTTSSKVTFGFFLRSPKLVQTYSLCALWLIISSCVLALHLLSVSASLHKHCHIFLHGWCSLHTFHFAIIFAFSYFTLSSY